MSYNLKAIKQEFKSKGIFYTQPELAEYMKTLIDVPIRDVYDPTCGDGGLLSVFPDETPKYGQELNDHQLTVAQSRLKSFQGVCGDTLENPGFMDKRFSCIMGNPPFSVEWQPPLPMFRDARFEAVPVLPPKSKADYAFLLHIMHLLADDGVAIVLNFPGILYRGQSEGVIRKWFVDNNWIDKIIQVPGKTFIDTAIATVILVLRKNKTTTNIEFADNELGLSRIVALDEIVVNDYNLSVNAYVQKQQVREVLDPWELQKGARANTLKQLEKDLEFDRMVCQIEGYDFNEYLDALKALINSKYKQNG